jgi:hypothetical protein
MQLRDHSLMKFRDLCNWPPAWARLGSAQGKASKKLTGEIGVPQRLNPNGTPLAFIGRRGDLDHRI